MTLIRRFLAVALATSFASMAVAAEGKLNIATVDMQELFKQYYKTNQAQKEINVERIRIQNDNTKRATVLSELTQSIEKIRKQLEDPSLSDTKKMALQKEGQLKVQEGTTLERDRNDHLQRQNRALQEKMVQRMKVILDEIRKLVETKAKLENYDFVFDKSGLSTSQVPVVVYTKDAFDITAGLLKELNKDAPPGSLPTPGDPPPEIPLPVPAAPAGDK